MYKAVVSPSKLGFKAKTTSFIPLFRINSAILAMFISSGPIPSIGDIKPFRTKYLPEYEPIFSNKKTFLGSSTTHRIELSLNSLLHISQILFSEKVLQISHRLTLLLTSLILSENKLITSSFNFNVARAKRSAVFSPIPGNFL